MREMKDSGVTWIGKIPEQWDISTINSLYTLRNQKVSDRDYPPLSVTMKGIVPQLETAAKTDAHDDRKLVKKGDFAINSRSDRRGSCGISDYDGSVSLINTVLTPRGEMHPVYYNWLFHSSSFADEFYRWGHGIVDDLWTTRWQEMRNITIPVPEYAVQQKIAAHLDRKCTQIDALISNAQQQIEKLKAYKQSVITETVTKGLDPDVKMKDSGVEWIGEIPEHWNVVKICRIADKTHPYSIGDGDHGLVKPDDYLDSGIPYIRVQNIGWCSELDLSNIVYISEQTNNKIKNSTLKPNDVLFAKTGATIGKTAIVPASMPISNTTSHVGKISVSPNYCAKYILYVLSSTIGYRQFWEFASAKTTRPELAIDEIRQILILLPPTKEQQAISDYLDLKCTQIDQLIALKQQKIEKLQQYKKSLIYEYVTGKKEV